MSSAYYLLVQCIRDLLSDLLVQQLLVDLTGNDANDGYADSQHRANDLQCFQTHGIHLPFII